MLNFVANFTNKQGTNMTKYLSSNNKEMRLYVDRLSIARFVGIGVCLISLNVIKIKQSVQLDFKATNNVVKFIVLLTNLYVFSKVQELKY